MEAPIKFGAPDVPTPCHCDRLPQREARLRRPRPKPSRVAVLCSPIDSVAAQAGDLDRGCRIQDVGEAQAILSERGPEQALRITRERSRGQPEDCDAWCQSAPLR